MPEDDPDAGLGCATALTGICCGPCMFGCFWILGMFIIALLLSAVGVDITTGDDGLSAWGWVVVVISAIGALGLTILGIMGAREENRRKDR